MDCGSRLDCQLQLSSVYLPGNVLRRKTLNDELMMREYFTEGDLVCAEVSVELPRIVTIVTISVM